MNLAELLSEGECVIVKRQVGFTRGTIGPHTLFLMGGTVVELSST